MPVDPLEHALQRLVLTDGPDDLQRLADIVDALRPGRLESSGVACERLKNLIEILRQNENYRAKLRDCILRTVAWRRCGLPLSELGLHIHGGVLAKIAKIFGRVLLPPIIDESSLVEVIATVFHHRHDYEWITQCPMEEWARLIDVLDFKNADKSKIDALRRDLLAGVSASAHRLAAMGVDPEVIRARQGMADFNQPFFQQARAAEHYCKDYLAWLDATSPGGTATTKSGQAIGLSASRTTPVAANASPATAPAAHAAPPAMPDAGPAFAALKKCEEIRAQIREDAAKNGASVHLTSTLSLMQTILERQRAMLTLLSASAPEKRQLALVDLLDDAIAAVNKRDSLRNLIVSHFDLLALNATQHAGKTGEHYAANTRSEYWGMFRAALGAGLIVPFMALAKIQISKLHLPPIPETILVCLNYGLGFVLIHMFHFTVATKQPAMTAARIAAAVNTQGGRLRDVSLLADLIQRVTRTQFVAILGNVMMALPLAWLIAWTFKSQLGFVPYSEEKAAHLIHDLHPLETLALPHAAIAGVCLFLAGLISGFYDNFAAYGRIPDRIRRHGALKWLLGEPRVGRLAAYMERNLGAIMGNFIFGCMLGIMPFIGKITGLPLDIRHITFGAANFSYGVTGVPEYPELEIIAYSLLGVALVGLTNLAVSFSLALWFALRSQHAAFARSSWKVTPLLLKRFVAAPFSYLLPPKDSTNTQKTPLPAETSAGSGH